MPVNALNQNNSSDYVLSRRAVLAPKVLVVDGLPGCGKTMMSPILGALDRVEKLSYAYEAEMICQLWSTGKIDLPAAAAMIRSFTDLILYNQMMGRNVNMRWADLSSVWMDVLPWRYLQRLWGPGDETVPARVHMEQPILHLTTHHLLGIGAPLFQALEDRLLFVDVLRHPLYMVKQQALNMDSLIGDVRYFFLHMDVKGKDIPFWTKGWEEDFLKANSAERAALSIIHMSQRVADALKGFDPAWRERVILIPFEKFVVDPWPFMDKITTRLSTQVTDHTRRMMKRQRVPREKFAQGINLAIYRRCGWQPAQAGASESDEFAVRRDWLKERVSSNILERFDECCRLYEKEHMDDYQNIPGRDN